MKRILTAMFLTIAFIPAAKAQTHQRKLTYMSCETDADNWQAAVNSLHSLPINEITRRQNELHECMDSIIPKPDLLRAMADKTDHHPNITYGLELEMWDRFQHLLTTYAEEVSARLMLFINTRRGLNEDLAAFDKGFVATYAGGGSQ